MRLRSFTEHIQGLHNLIDLALSDCDRETPPILLFCSSTASVLGPSAKYPIAEEISRDPTSASPLGYSRSKWVAEAICQKAHEDTRLRNRIGILRIGQLTGDTKDGIWNATEAWPMMLSSMRVTGALPDLQEVRSKRHHLTGVYSADKRTSLASLVASSRHCCRSSDTGWVLAQATQLKRSFKDTFERPSRIDPNTPSRQQ